MQDLIERLEKATGPDRRLDVAIYVAELPHPCVEMDKSAQDKFDAERAPAYTESIDAALTLVPDGERVDMKREGHTDGNAYACVWGAHGNRPTRAATLPIALCISALKARAPLLAKEQARG